MTKSRSKSSRRAKVAAKPKAPAADAEEEKVTGFKEGRWDDDEHDRFIVAMADFVDGNNAPVNQSARREKWGAIAAARARVRRPREVAQPREKQLKVVKETKKAPAAVHRVTPQPSMSNSPEPSIHGSRLDLSEGFVAGDTAANLEEAPKIYDSDAAWAKVMNTFTEEVDFHSLPVF
ncbi:hypothetical protein JL720_2137 [Aureococcus anophagefferens]|nr:hypothetical protein JL720_2137 [Aureococcus anophagefferens]